MKTYLCIGFFWWSAFLLGQEIRVTLVDSLTKDPIPYATVLSNFNENTIANEEGDFRLIKSTPFTLQDSLFISCMGYQNRNLRADQVQDSLLYLAPKEIELNAVILTQNNLTAEEIIQKAQENIAAKYNLDLSEKTFFMRESFYQKYLKREMKVKRSSIKEFNQQFWDSIFKTIPVEDAWHTESYGKLYGDWSKENQKLRLDRAVELADTVNEKGYDQIENKITSVLDQQVKENSYFKFKSGIFSTKVDREEVIEKPKDSTQVASTEAVEKEEEEEEFPPEEAFYRRRSNRLKNIFSSFVKKNKLDLSVLTKSKYYAFELINFTYLEDTPVYQIAFKPNHKKGKYTGTLYIDADSFALLQIEFKNNAVLNSFSLFGLSFEMYHNAVQLKFNKFGNNKYNLQYLTTDNAFTTGIDRPFKVVEKNKFVRGRRKQNELKGEVHFNLDQRSQITLVIFDEAPLSEKSFTDLKENKIFTPEKRNAYDPSFWEGYNILAPNASVKAYIAN